MSLRKTRLLKELALLESFNHEGIKFISQDNGNLETLEFEIIGPEGTPFSNEKLQLEIKLTNKYPLEPPILRFTTPVRHPNIDEVSGRICLDLLRMPPEGSWRPNVSLSSVLVTVQVLLGEPNLDDPVRPDLISEWRRDETEYYVKMENNKVEADVKNDENINVIIRTNDENTNSIKNPKRTFSLSLSEIRKKPKSAE